MIPFLLFGQSSAAAVVVPLLTVAVSEAAAAGCSLTEATAYSCAITEEIVE
jgi:hypothetical protein